MENHTSKGLKIESNELHQAKLNKQFVTVQEGPKACHTGTSNKKPKKNKMRLYLHRVRTTPAGKTMSLGNNPIPLIHLKSPTSLQRGEEWHGHRTPAVSGSPKQSNLATLNVPIPPPLARATLKTKKKDGNNTYPCSDKGAALARGMGG